MQTIDFNTVVDNLKTELSHKEILEQAGIKKINPEAIQKSFEEAQALLDLHHEVCPDLHTKDFFLVSA